MKAFLHRIEWKLKHFWNYTICRRHLLDVHYPRLAFYSAVVYDGRQPKTYQEFQFEDEISQIPGYPEDRRAIALYYARQMSLYANMDRLVVYMNEHYPPEGA